ncbi:MAG: hypothetical protein JWM85_297 [Acidimicrobiaceae bacterium]|nr:hypothetical protein [Acidimicrobiaceae bacterium]
MSAAVALPRRVGGARSGSRADRARLEAPLLLGVLLAGLLVCLARSPSVLLHPELWAEDGQVWFRSAYEQGWLHPLATPHTGYYQSFPRLVSDLGLNVPLQELPALFMVVAVLVQVLPAVLLASSRFATAVPSLLARLVLAAAYLALPNTLEVNANLTNAQWHLGLLALLVALAAPGGTPWRIFDVVVVVLSGLTGPFCLALLPIAAIVWAARRRTWTAVLFGVDLACAGLQAYALASSARGHYGPLGASANRLVEILGGQVVGGTLLGSASLDSVRSGGENLLICGLLLGLGALLVGWALVAGPLELKMVNLYAGLVLAASLATPVASIDHPQWQILVETGGLRYWFLPAAALVADVFFLLRSARRLPVAVGLVLLCTLVGLGVREDFRYPAAPRHDWGAQVARFDALPKGIRFSFSIDPARWHMTLVKR